MSAAREYIDPPAADWLELDDDAKRACIETAIDVHPKLLDRFYCEALSAGVNLWDIYKDIS